VAVHALEAMADAIMQYEGWHLGSRSWRNRNPGNLRDSHWGHKTDDDGYCVFGSLTDGYDALLDDLKAKVKGKSSHHLTPTSTLSDLFDVYAPRADSNNPNAYAAFVAGYLTHALSREITTSTELGTLAV
jgi:hypothetical protein